MSRQTVQLDANGQGMLPAVLRPIRHENPSQAQPLIDPVTNRIIQAPKAHGAPPPREVLVPPRVTHAPMLRDDDGFNHTVTRFFCEQCGKHMNLAIVAITDDDYDDAYEQGERELADRRVGFVERSYMERPNPQTTSFNPNNYSNVPRDRMLPDGSVVREQDYAPGY